MKVFFKPTTKFADNMEPFLDKEMYAGADAIVLNDVISMNWLAFLERWDIYFTLNGTWESVNGSIKLGDILRVSNA